MIAAPRLIDHFELDRTCPEGVAATRAAIDWRRAGLVRPIPRVILEELYGNYLNGPATPERLTRGLEWATTPLYAHVALLQGKDEYQPYDYLAAHAQRRKTPIPADTWRTIVERYATTEELSHAVGVAALEAGEVNWAERAFRLADDRGDGLGAANLGLLLFRERGDPAGAKEASRRAEVRGHPGGPLNLGEFLEREGDYEGAATAYRRAHAGGHRRGAFKLGLLLLNQLRDLERAEAAFRLAADTGYAPAAVNLGVLLEWRGDDVGAETAYRRAAESGVPEGIFNFGVALQRRGDVEGAVAA